MKPFIIISDTRQELPLKYKRLIEQKYPSCVVIVASQKEMIDEIYKNEPELIIISDNFEGTISENIKTLRSLELVYRPIIIALSKSDYSQDKLDVLNAGADDFLSEPIELEEFEARINAHIRRDFENSSNMQTKISNTTTTFKNIQRSINLDKDWALMVVDVDNFDEYKQIYGQIASEKMTQAFVAMLKSCIDKNDFLGHLEENKFAIITNIYKYDKIASYLQYAFDSVASKFYTEEDIARGYLMMYGDEKAGRRIPFVSLSTGVITNEHRQYANYKEAINSVLDMHMLAKTQIGSSWIVDKPQLCDGDRCSFIRNKILIVEEDAALACLLTSTLAMQGYVTEAFSDLSEAGAKLVDFEPDLIILDAKENFNDTLLTCKSLKNNLQTSHIKIIISTTIQDKENVLNSGADLYFPKPYDLEYLFKWLKKLLSY